jgi:hypothetical protein
MSATSLPQFLYNFMKKFVILITVMLSSTVVRGENIELKTATHTGTFSKYATHYEIRIVTSSKCSVKASGANTKFEEVNVTGSFDSESAASAALRSKINILFNGLSVIKTADEFAYSGWESNGDSDSKNIGDDSKADFDKWKSANTDATEITTEPSLPCDAADPTNPDTKSTPIDDAGKVTRSTTTTKYYKFSYKISFKKP